MKEVAGLLNGMRESGVIEDYALFGAAAQMRYTEAVATLDAHVLVAMSPPPGLAVLEPIYAYCRDRGYTPEGEAVRVGAWPVQFIDRGTPEGPTAAPAWGSTRPQEDQIEGPSLITIVGRSLR